LQNSIIVTEWAQPINCQLKSVFSQLRAYFAYSVTLNLGNFWFSLLISRLIVGTLGVLIERFLLRKTYKGGHTAQLLLVFGLLLILGEFARIIWGTAPLTMSVPQVLVGSISFIGKTYPIYRLFILGFLFWCFLEWL
jgi:branched-chain amino acid transport system permease protein